MAFSTTGLTPRNFRTEGKPTLATPDNVVDRDAAEQQPEDASMNPHRPTAGNGVHRTPGILLALVSAITLVAIVACSGDEPPPTDRPDRSQPQLEQTIEATDTEIAALQTETAESDRSQPQLEQTVEALDTEIAAFQNDTAESDTTPDRDHQPPATDQTDMNTPGSPLSTNTPTPVEAMKPTGPGICGRSPVIQRILLADLNISLCHAVTTPELFRITEFGVAMNSAQQGDFEGLVNVQDMVVSANKFEPRALSGLDSLERLTLVVFPDTSLAPTALEGLDELTNLTIQKTTGDQNAEDTVELPGFPELPKLKELVIDKVKSHQDNTWPEDMFTKLPALEVLEINYELFTTKGKLGFSPDLFKNNAQLKVVTIRKATPPRYEDSHITIEIPENLFQHNTLLEEITFEGSIFGIPRDTFAKLHNLKELQLSQQRIAGERLKHRIVLSKQSPLYELLEEEPWRMNGYVLVNAN